MSREEALEEFLKSFRIALNHAFVYFSEHPMFVHAVEDLHDRLSDVLKYSAPLKIGIAPHALSIDGKFFDYTRAHKELAELFHYRKVKFIEFQSRITPQELRTLICVLALPLKDFFVRGGIGRIIKKEALQYIRVEELDYSQLLTGEGKEYKDIWAFLLGTVIEGEKPAEVEEFVTNFPKVLAKFRNCDFLENESLRENMVKFLEYLKKKDQPGFHKCAKELTKAILRDKNTPEEKKFDKLKVLLANLDEEDLAQTLWDEILTDDDFDVLSFTVFSRLIDKEKHETISSVLSQKIKEEHPETFNPKMHKKIRELFLQASTPLILETYRRTFSPLLKNIPTDDVGFLFDREVLKKNYRTMLLNLFVEEKKGSHINRITERIVEELEAVGQEKDFGYLEALLELTAKAKKENPLTEEFSDVIERHAYRILEDGLLKEANEPDLEFFVDVLKKSSYGVDFYLDNIFSQGKISPAVLKLFFKFFPGALPDFYRRMAKKINEHVFLKNIIESLGHIDSRISVAALEYLFPLCGNFFKIEILKSMQRISFLDEDFIFSILRKGDIYLKRQALGVIWKNANAKKKAARILLDIANPLGIRNNVMRQNLEIIQEMDLRDAAEYLPPLIKRSFWNRPIKKQAQALLSAWISV